jgi:hypothetical protein
LKKFNILLELIVANIATIHPELLPKRQLYIPITEWQQARMTQTFLNYWRNNMKTLTTTAIILSLALSGSAFAEFEGHLDTQWINSIGTSQSQTMTSQPEVGSSSYNSGIDFSKSVLREVEKLIQVNEQ